MKETKNVPQLRFSGFDDDWKEVIFSEIFTERHDISTITKDYPQLSFTIAEGVIRPEDRKTNQRDFLIKDKENKQYLKTELNDIIYNPANVVFGAIHRNGLGNGVLSPIYKIFYTNEDSVFLEGIVRNPEFIKKIANQTEGTVTKLKTLKPENFLQMRSFISPYLQEQQKIGVFLSHVDSLIQANTKKLESLKAVKKSLLQKCFPKAGEKVPEMRFAGFSGDWEEKKLGEFCKLFGRIGFRGYTEKDLVKEGEGAITLSPSNIVDGIMNYSKCTYISWYKYEESPEIKINNGDILLVKTGSTFGKTALVTNLPCEATINPQFVVIKNIKIDNIFLSYLLSHDLIQNQINSTVVGGAIPTMSQEVIKNFNILIPSATKEQQKIGHFFSKYDSLISAQQKEIDKLKDIKKSLLQKMFV